MNDEILKEATKRFRTPLYIYDEDELRRQLARISSLLNPDASDPDKAANAVSKGQKIGLTYSMKANPFVTKEASESVERIEVCSFGEFRICEALGIPADKLLISGVLKKKDEVMEMVQYGGSDAIYTAESPLQLKYLEEAGEKQHKVLPVLVRLTSGNQFGMDEETILDLIGNRARMPHLKLTGLHFFSGTRKKNLRKTEKELKKLDAFSEEVLKKTGLSISMIEYGTGFTAPYFEGEKETLTPEFMSHFRDLVSAMAFRGRLTVEMGRAAAYSCGYYLTTVMDKKRTGATDFCILDGGIHQLNYDGQMRGMFQPFTMLISSDQKTQMPDGAPAHTALKETDQKKESSCVICGSLCTVNDVLIADYKKEPPEIGDVLVFRNVGAYSLNEGMSTFLSHELPEVLVFNEEKGLRTARRALPGWQLNFNQEAAPPTKK